MKCSYCRISAVRDIRIAQPGFQISSLAITMLLQVSNIDTYYGTSHVLQGVSLSVGEGEVVALLGRNGVGKTTTLRSIIGSDPARSGARSSLMDQEIAGQPAYTIARLAWAICPTISAIFPDLTTEENLEIARKLSKRTGYWDRDRVYRAFPKLGDFFKAKGINLSGGEKRCWGSAGP